MSLLHDIQEAASSSNVPIANVLRKCSILAARLKSDEFKKWVTSELNGYDWKDVPDYRIVKHTNLFVDIVGSYGFIERKVPLHLSNDQYGELMRTVHIMQDIPSLEQTLLNNSGDTFLLPMPPFVTDMLQQKRVVPYQCLNAYWCVGRYSILATLEKVRTKVMEFTNAVERENPDAGEAAPSITPVPTPVVSQIYNNTIHGGAVSIAQGSHDFQQNARISDIEKQLNMNVDMETLAQELPILKAKLVSEASDEEDFNAIASVAAAEKAAKEGDKNKALESLKRASAFIGDKAADLGISLTAEVIKKILMGG